MITHKVDTDGFEGEIILRPPDFGERYEYKARLAKYYGDDAEGSKNQNGLRAVAEMVRLASDHVEKVDVRKGKKSFNSFESLSVEPSADSVLIDMARALINGGALGED